MRGNLPSSLTRIVGRDDIIAALTTQLARRRFLTIVGPGDVKVAHSADEHVPIAEVEDCANVLAAWVRHELLA